MGNSKKPNKVPPDEVRLSVPLGLFLCISSRTVKRGKATPLLPYLAIEDRWGSGKNSDGTPKARACWERADRIAKRCGLATSTIAVEIDRLIEWGYVKRAYCLGNEKLPIWEERFVTEEEAAARQAEIKEEEGRSYTIHRILTPPTTLPRLADLVKRGYIRPGLLEARRKKLKGSSRAAGERVTDQPERGLPAEQEGACQPTEMEVTGPPDINDTPLTNSPVIGSPTTPSQGKEEEDSPSSSNFKTKTKSAVRKEQGQKKLGRAATDELSDQELAGARAMAAALDRAHRLRRNNVPLVIKPSDPEWPHIVAASKQAKEAGVSPDDWIAAIISALCSFSTTSNPFPHPSQLYGPKAANHVGNYKGATGPCAQAVRRARSAKGVPLNEDHEYQRIRNRMKKGIHTAEDVAYMRTRQIEVYGAEKPWLKDVEASAQKPSPKAASPEARAHMNGKHPAGVH